VNALSYSFEEAGQSEQFAEFQAEVWATEDSYQSAEEFQGFLTEQHDLINRQLEAYGFIEGS
jgi:hypothetical protein